MKKTGMSANYRYRGKTFRYDYDNKTVGLFAKAGEEEIQDEKEWIEKFGKPLLGIGEDGYYGLGAVGLRQENWENKEARNEYLDEWIEDLDEEAAMLMADFIRYEL